MWMFIGFVMVVVVGISVIELLVGDVMVIDYEVLIDCELVWLQIDFLSEVLVCFEGDLYNEGGFCWLMCLNVVEFFKGLVWW